MCDINVHKINKDMTQSRGSRTPMKCEHEQELMSRDHVRPKGVPYTGQALFGRGCTFRMSILPVGLAVMIILPACVSSMYTKNVSPTSMLSSKSLAGVMAVDLVKHSRLAAFIEKHGGGELLESFQRDQPDSFQERAHNMLAQLTARSCSAGSGLQLYPYKSFTSGKRIVVLDFPMILSYESIVATSIRQIHLHLVDTAAAMGIELELVVETDLGGLLPEGFRRDYMENVYLMYKKVHVLNTDHVQSSHVLQVLSKNHYHGIINWNEAAMAVVSHAADKLGIPFMAPDGPLISKLGNPPRYAAPSKRDQRQTLEESGVNGPRFALVNSTDDIESAAQKVGFPAFFKPAIGVGMSAGFMSELLKYAQVHSTSELTKSYKIMRNMMRNFSVAVVTGGFVLEQLLSGPEVYAEVVAFQEVKAISLRADVTPGPGTIAHTFPANLTEDQHTQCLNAAWEVAEGLGLTHGVFGIQMKFNPAEGCKFLELNLRPHMWSLMFDTEFHTFLQRDYWDYVEAALLIALDMDPGSRIGRTPLPPASLSVVCDNLAIPNGNSGIFHLGQLLAWTNGGQCKVAIAKEPHTAAMMLQDVPAQFKRNRTVAFLGTKYDTVDKPTN